MKRMISALCAATVPLLMTAPADQARADTIIGVFDPNSILLTGNVLDDPGQGDQTFVDNTGTAVSSISNSTNPATSGGFQATGSTLTWGTNTPAGADTYSTLTFQGGLIPANPTSSFLAGQITFLNGTSALNSLIFGVTIDLYDNSVSAANFLGADQIIINTTSNLYSGTGLSLAQLQTDADTINICGNSSNICDNPLGAFEDSEGGVGVVADLTGAFVNDPTLDLQSIALAPGQDPDTSGYIGDSPPLATPEPGSLALLAGGLASVLFVRRRERQRA